MKKLLLLLTIITLVFTGCKKDDDNTTKNLDIKLETGKTYRFSETSITATSIPNDFVAQIKNNEIEGMHEGETQAVVQAGNTTYNCNIKITPAHTFYIDMAIYLGQSGTNIIKLYGNPIKTVDNSSLFGPLLSLPLELNNIFSFNSNGKVTSCAIYFPITSGVRIAEHLKDRYTIYSTKDYTTVMGDASQYDKCKVVALYDYSDSPVSVYYTTKAELDKKSGSSELTIETRANLLKSLLLQK